MFTKYLAQGGLWSRIGLIFLAFGLVACAPAGKSEQTSEGREGPLVIASTTGMVTDLVRRVAGEQAVVTGLIGEGVDPHLYKPTRDDLLVLQEADVIFYNGLHLEGKMSDVFVRLARTGKPVFAVTERIEASGGYVLAGEEGAFDPHVWMDVAAWQVGAEVVAAALVEVDPDNAEVYRANAAAYAAEMEELDQWARETLATIPEENRVLITAHDAFQYFGRAYGLEVRGVQGISTESEAGLKDLEELVHFLVEGRIPAVFMETSVSDKNVKALLEGARAMGHEVRIGGALFSDAIGTPGTWEGTYPGMIDNNVSTITRALGGRLNEGGYRALHEPE